jgi:hypothetical protein
MARAGRPRKEGLREPNGRLWRRTTLEYWNLSSAIGLDNQMRCLLRCDIHNGRPFPKELKKTCCVYCDGEILFYDDSGLDRLFHQTKIGRLQSSAFGMAAFWVMAHLPGRLSGLDWSKTTQRSGFDFGTSAGRAAALRSAKKKLSKTHLETINRTVLDGQVESGLRAINEALTSLAIAWGYVRQRADAA